MNEATAFHKLVCQLAGLCDGTNWSAADIPSIDRLRRALLAPPYQTSNIDLAVLLRQVLVHESLRRNWEPAAECEVLGARWEGFQDWSRVGLTATPISGGWRVSVKTWRPDWIESSGTVSAEAWASGENVCRNFEAASVPADPFLSKLNRTAYRSLAQRNAVRAALRAPVGSTLVISLATGEGKSLIPHAVAVAGYDNYLGGSGLDGVTLVVVPTVALALDQEAAAAKSISWLELPLAYRSRDQSNNQKIIEKITAGSQLLCYASPEAVCGALREPLKAAASAGRLKAIVIDEAHLVDTWGTGFRTEFQLLGGLRRELIKLSPEHRLPRTLLLSATLTESALATLRTMFSSPGEFAEFSCSAPRLEPEYWIASPTNEDERIERVTEAVYHVPRPAILYVTRVIDAVNWFERISSLGFRRIRLVTGKTGSAERDVVLEKWRKGEIDLVVATSAFGLGIDYPHVRSVIHACIPESLDRFYQEVGRAGRDGRACMSLLIPAHGDWGIAERISDVTVIGIDRGIQRWRAMFEHAEHVPNSSVFNVRLNVSPSFDDEDIDMVGERSADWNARVLTLMERAGLIRQCGMEQRTENYEPWQKVEVIDHDHLQLGVWQRRIGPLRRVIAETNSNNLNLMRRYIMQRDCISRLLVQLYGRNRTGAVCTSCARCRVTPESRVSPHEISQIFPWSQPLPPSASVLELMDSSYRIVVFYEFAARDSRWFRRLGEVLEVLSNNGVNNLTLLGDRDGFDQEVIRRLSASSWFVAKANQLLPARLPPGPEVILATDQSQLTRINLSPREINKARIFILPSDTESPDRPGIRLSQCFNGRMFLFDEFHQRLLR